MRYKYGVINKVLNHDCTIVRAPALADIIKRDVNVGKWNIYEGGDKEHAVQVSFKGSSWVHSEHMFIWGSESEIKHLEQLISGFIKVIPRKF